MDIVTAKPPAVYAYGATRAHTAGRCPPTYTPVAAEPWDDEDVDDWADACARDARRESDGGAW